MIEPSNFFKAVRTQPERFYIIHYSSQALYDEGIEAFSPRITSVVVMQFQLRQTQTFCLHSIAEELGIGRDDVEARYDDIERELLSRFFSFVKNNQDKYFVHWNMRNQVFGFEHLEHRFRVLTGEEPPRVPIEFRLNLNDILKVKYGADYAADPRMASLMLLNGKPPRGFLTGEQEAEAFKRKEFIRMNSSTICKVEFFRHVIVAAQQGKLRTAGRGWVHRIDRLLENRWARAAALFGSLVGVGAILVNAYRFVASLSL
ncbi:hypothetical protein [Bosea sp. CS1GBMeth4]|uniref:hypothetical protein n=1 Tax=Bosea sp. CS1GBMeth4 TaxID=1892849 RepID=UPI001AECC19B|nr:hypothetical protein [Bosea sp. CS1GBMeth4]